MEVYKILSDFEAYSNVSAQEYNSKYEAGIISQTLRHLQRINPDFYSEFCVCILLNNGVDVKTWNITNFSDKKRIFIIFDENGRTPLELLERGSVVFHAHLSFADTDRKYTNLFHYPLGCNSFVPETPYVPASERKINVFFSGNLHIGRKKLFQELTHLHFVPFPLLVRGQNLVKANFDTKFPNSYIRFTNGFSKGFSFDEYGNYLSNSKIVLSPPGISNPECFRHYEGLRAGCVVIAESLPVKPQFVGSPIIEVTNWFKGFKAIGELLNDPKELDELSRRSYEWYRAHLSAQPTAQYILEKVRLTHKNKFRN